MCAYTVVRTFENCRPGEEWIQCKRGLALVREELGDIGSGLYFDFFVTIVQSK